MKRLARKYLPPILALAVIALLLIVAIRPPVGGRAHEYWPFYASFVVDVRYLALLLVVPLMLTFGVLFDALAKSIKWRWLNWSPFDFGFVALPVASRWLWLPYSVLLALCIPYFAWMEEVLFRLPANNWAKGIMLGVLTFGFLHILGLVPIRMLLYFCLLGLVFVEVYFSYGLAAAFVFHTTYSVLALALIILIARFGLNSKRPLVSRVRNGLARRN